MDALRLRVNLLFGTLLDHLFLSLFLFWSLSLTHRPLQREAKHVQVGKESQVEASQDWQPQQLTQVCLGYACHLVVFLLWFSTLVFRRLRHSNEAQTICWTIVWWRWKSCLGSRLGHYAQVRCSLSNLCIRVSLIMVRSQLTLLWTGTWELEMMTKENNSMPRMLCCCGMPHSHVSACVPLVHVQTATNCSTPLPQGSKQDSRIQRCQGWKVW
jgi:hypothetical protein